MQNPLLQKVQDAHQGLLQALDREPGEHSGSAAEQRIRRARLLVISSGPMGAQAVANLLQQPFATLTLIGFSAADRDALNQLSQQPRRRAQNVIVMPQPYMLTGLSIVLAEHHLAVVATSRPHPSLLEQINETALRTGTPWTQALLWASEFLLGPTIIPGVTACHHCYTVRRRANESRQDVAATVDTFLRHEPDFEFRGQIAPAINLAAAYLTAEVTRVIGGAQTPLALSRIVSFDLLAQHQSSDYITPLEWCPLCHALREAPSGPTLAAMVERLIERQEGVLYAAS
jgi:bacteriocin biosynthesis cyclodehydratase domain-containing protein